MSARHRGRRHGSAGDAVAASGAAVIGVGAPAVEIVPAELGPMTLAASVPAAAASAEPASLGTGSAAEALAPLGIRPDHSNIDGAAGIPQDASRSGGFPESGPRRAPRVRDSAPAAPAAAAWPAPASAPIIAESGEPQKPACTLAQMRRFIKSRPYVPVHELRRRFLIEGNEDDVNAVMTERGVVYVGLPVPEAQFLSDLIRAGEVGCELLLDPTSPAVVGVYAMRPVARQ